MSEKNDQDITSESETLPVPDTAEPAQTESEIKAESPTVLASKTVPQKTSSSALIFLLPVFLVCAIVAVAGWYLWKEKQQLNEHTASLASQIEQTRTTLALLQQEQAQQQALITAAEAREAELKQQLLATEQRVQAQHKRLQSMSTTSREDWLLAEAEYLLRLANQRVLIEKSPRSADALLVEADAILKKLDDPDLFSLRQAIANDLAKLRLVEKIDREGLYFSLNALIDQVDTLSLRPTRQEVMAPLSNEQTTVEENDSGASAESGMVEDKSVWIKIGVAIKETLAFLGNYIRVTDHSERPPALLPPDAAAYLQQNLRFKLERAQLALLREEQEIYAGSLNDALAWLDRYYPKAVSAEAFAGELKGLREKNVVQELPDISYSLELLHEYIENLHDLKGVEAQKQTRSAPIVNGEAL